MKFADVQVITGLLTFTIAALTIGEPWSPVRVMGFFIFSQIAITFWFRARR